MYALDKSAWYQWLIPFSFTLWLTDIRQYKQGISEGLLLGTWWLTVSRHLPDQINWQCCLYVQPLIPALADNQSLVFAPSPLAPGTSTRAPCSSPACWSSRSPASPGLDFSLTSSVASSLALSRPEGTLKIQRSRRRRHRWS